MIYDNVFLWDGEMGRIIGNLQISPTKLTFTPSGFENTNLTFDLLIRDIVSIKIQKIFDISLNGLLIQTLEDKRNLFIVENPISLRDTIKKLILSNHNL